uniref:mitogen-activated protein kinase kinase n=1 Tax=Macrostomum lignano TaxID=282301 RepID=A0A1I8GL32_9PLAT
MPAVGKLLLPDDATERQFSVDDLEDLGEIGRGAFGAVNRMRYTPTGVVLAVKRIRSTVDERQQKNMLLELNVVVNCQCEFIARSYGALFKEGDCWICMELMDTSLDKFYRIVYHHLHEAIPEVVIARIALATVSALDYLKEKLGMMHRDVKPSNILADRRGRVKLCDFGIAGKLVDSIAKTRDAGCRPYMAPERIDHQRMTEGYDVRSDVWSLGISLYELCTGRFPYRQWGTMFEQLEQVVKSDPPRLTDIRYSEEARSFANLCLTKDVKKRPKYRQLLQHPFLLESAALDADADIAAYFCSVLNRTPEEAQLADLLGAVHKVILCLTKAAVPSSRMADPSGASANTAATAGSAFVEGIGSEVVVCLFILLAGLILVAAWLSTYVPQDMRPIAVFVFENFGRYRPGEQQQQPQQVATAPLPPAAITGPAPIPTAAAEAPSASTATTETPSSSAARIATEPATVPDAAADAGDTTAIDTPAAAAAVTTDLAAYDVDVLESDGDLDPEMRERVEDVLNEYTQVMEAKNDSELRNRRLKYFNCLLTQPADSDASASVASTSGAGTGAAASPVSASDTPASAVVVGSEAASSSILESSSAMPSAAPAATVDTASAAAPTSSATASSSRPPGSLLLRLKYFNDDLRTVVALPNESIANFKRKHFQVEMSRNMNIRLIYNGRELKEGTDCTLASYAIPEEATIHCLITERNTSANEESGAAAASGGGGGAAEGDGVGPLEGQGDIGSYMFPLFGGILGIIWYCRVCYKAYFNFMSTMALGAVTLLFFAAFFASWSARPPRQTGQIHVHRINLDAQQQQQQQQQDQQT